MNCCDCARESVNNPAVAVCQVCSAGLCRKQLIETGRAVTVTKLLNRVEELPQKHAPVLMPQVQGACGIRDRDGIARVGVLWTDLRLAWRRP